MNYLMLDIETYGLTHDADIIQIAALECIKDGPYYIPGKSYNQILHSDQLAPPFSIASHPHLIPLVASTHYRAPIEIRAGLVGFFQSCGFNKQAPIMGLNAAGFDIPFLKAKNYLIDKDVHYRVYDINSAANLASDILCMEKSEVFKRANEVAPRLFELPNGTKHDAVVDCLTQLNTLNGIISLVKLHS